MEIVDLLQAVRDGLAERIAWNLEADRLQGAANAGFRIEAEELKKLSDKVQRAMELATPC